MFSSWSKLGLKCSHVLLMSCLSCLLGSPALAAVQTIDFDITLDEDSFASGQELPDLYGEVLTASFQWNDNDVGPGDFELGARKLSIDVTLLGLSYDERDDEGYPSFPIMEFEDGVAIVCDLLLDIDAGTDFGDPRILEVQVGFSRFLSSYNYNLRIETVPEPSAVSTTAAALGVMAGLVRTRRRQRS